MKLDKTENSRHVNSKNRDFNPLFCPKNVVIYKASPKISFFVEGFLRQGFDIDNLYLISSKHDSLNGIKCYKTFDEIPIEEIDLLILSIRRELLIESLNYILEKKKIKFIHIFTAGTGESDELGKKLELKLARLLQSHENTRAIGPNCMGIYCPKGKIAYYASFPVEPGNIGLIFQSGDLHSKMIKFGSSRYKLNFAKGVSVGNCVDIQVSELLEYYNNDDEIDLICVYFEGFPRNSMNEGRKLFKTFRKIKKPVLFMRGGITNRGKSAVLTHTGTIASSQNIWKAVFKQTPVIQVEPSLDDLIDYAFMFHHLIKMYKNLKKDIIYPKNKKALVILWSGGFGILATDTLTELGIELPRFEGEMLEKLKKIYPLKIGSLSNPLDLPWITSRPEFFEISKNAISGEIDLIIVETDAWRELESDRFKQYYENLLKLKNYSEGLGKIFVIILHQYPSKSREIFYNMLLEDEFLVYPTIKNAAIAFLKLHEYGKKINV
ncbi:MAG: CoA-binding protein [Promethearchaeota archaeon]